MDTVDKIATVIPKLKYQLIFLKERELLITMNADSSLKSADSSTASLSISIEPTSSAQTTFDDDAELNQSVVERKHSDRFPDQYAIPPLPNSLMKDIEDGSLDKFGPHYSNRQILIDAIAHDLIDGHKSL